MRRNEPTTRQHALAGAPTTQSTTNSKVIILDSHYLTFLGKGWEGISIRSPLHHHQSHQDKKILRDKKLFDVLSLHHQLQVKKLPHQFSKVPPLWTTKTFIPLKFPSLAPLPRKNFDERRRCLGRCDVIQLVPTCSRCSRRINGFWHK